MIASMIYTLFWCLKVFLVGGVAIGAVVSLLIIASSIPGTTLSRAMKTDDHDVNWLGYIAIIIPQTFIAISWSAYVISYVYRSTSTDSPLISWVAWICAYLVANAPSSMILSSDAKSDKPKYITLDLATTSSLLINLIVFIVMAWYPLLITDYLGWLPYVGR